MPKEFDVTIVETLKMKVTVAADSLEEAEQLVSDGWYRGEYILDAECFEGVEFESAEPVIDLSYREMSDVFHHINDKHKEPVCGYIVFSPDSFNKPYSSSPEPMWCQATTRLLSAEPVAILFTVLVLTEPINVSVLRDICVEKTLGKSTVAI